MSTRCNVKVVFDEDHSKLFYHQYNGYPDCVGAELVELVSSELTGNTGKAGFHDFCELLIEDYGYDAADYESGDIEWYYEVIVPECKVHCYKCDWRTDTKILVSSDLGESLRSSGDPLY